jgi:hypothetical protein
LGSETVGSAVLRVVYLTIKLNMKNKNMQNNLSLFESNQKYGSRGQELVTLGKEFFSKPEPLITPELEDIKPKHFDEFVLIQSFAKRQFHIPLNLQIMCK